MSREFSKSNRASLAGATTSAHMDRETQIEFPEGIRTQSKSRNVQTGADATMSTAVSKSNTPSAAGTSVRTDKHVGASTPIQTTKSTSKIEIVLEPNEIHAENKGEMEKIKRSTEKDVVLNEIHTQSKENRELDTGQ